MNDEYNHFHAKTPTDICEKCGRIVENKRYCNDCIVPIEKEWKTLTLSGNIENFPVK